MSNFDDLSMAVASFGGNNKVIFDDLEKPSIMVGIPNILTLSRAGRRTRWTFSKWTAWNAKCFIFQSISM